MIEYVSISKNKHGNITTLYQKRPLSAERDDRYNEREKHISLYNIHNKNNNELKQKEEKINKFIGKTKILDKVKLTDNGKLFVFGSQKTYLFDLNSDFVEEIPIGRAMFLNERYLAFDINNVELPFSSKVFQWCKENKNNSWGCTTHGYHQDGMIAFYDLISKEVSNIYITYNGDICGHLGREIVFDKEGEQVGIICHDSFVTKESGDYEHFYKEKMYIYRLKKEKDIIVAVDNIFEKDFHKLKVYKPQFSVNGKEIYFIQAKHPYSIDHHFVRWDINNYKELQSSKIDMHYIYNYHYRPKYNDLFLVGQVNKKTLAMFSKNNSPNITNNPNTMSFYYHNLNKSNGYWDELNPARVNTRDLRNAAKIDHMCDDGFFFSESGNVFMPVCRGYSHTYFIHNGEEKPQYYRKILRKIEDGIDE
ncbi:MAG: hypothetical protein IJV35_09035 [Neisseriaceae bacterium]|nr:hypothetical protein [Neisseriaceae bacterium]